MKKKREVSTMAAQGDVLLRRVATLPAGAVERSGKDAKIIAHSETGHHHTVEGSGVRVFSTLDPLVSYVAFSGSHADVVHHRPWDTHETLRLLKGDTDGEVIFEIRRQREWSPEGWKIVAD